MQSTFSTPIGPCSILWNDTRLTGFRLLGETDERTSLEDEPPTWVAAIIKRVQRHLSGSPQDFSDLPFDFSSLSPFQRSVYETALTVKSGTTRSYGWLAAAMGKPPSACRAVGTALGQNRWLLLVPCHRFVGSTGKLTGFSAPGGIETKRRLLALESVELFATI